MLENQQLTVSNLLESNYQFTCKYIELQVFFKIFSDFCDKPQRLGFHFFGKRA